MSMRLAWLTDLHLNFVGRAVVDAFFQEVASELPDAVLLTGDVGEADSVVPYLLALGERLPCPIYFVLGNHDFYGDGVEAVRDRVLRCCRQSSHLRWLSEIEVVGLTASTGLVGHDGWADGRYGDYLRSKVDLNDYHHIQELTGLTHAQRFGVVQHLGDEGAAHLDRVLPLALARYRKVIVLTHVPPFRDACRHDGQVQDDQWAPHFGCRAVGDVLLEAATAHPDRELIVFCGHTHSPAHLTIAPNLTVIVGSAVYGKPVVQAVMDAD